MVDYGMSVYDEIHVGVRGSLSSNHKDVWCRRAFEIGIRSRLLAALSSLALNLRFRCPVQPSWETLHAHFPKLNDQAGQTTVTAQYQDSETLIIWIDHFSSSKAVHCPFWGKQQTQLQKAACLCRKRVRGGW